MKKVLGLIQLFVGISALTASIPAITKTTTESGGKDIHEFLAQGTLLLLLVAIPSLVGAYYSLNDYKKTKIVGLVSSVLFTAWIALHFYYLGYQSLMQILFLFVAVSQLIVVERIFTLEKKLKI